MDTPPNEMSPTKDKMTSDLRTLVSDAEQVLRSTAGYSNETIASARTRLNEGLDRMKEFMAQAQSSATDQYRRAATATDSYVRENPWQALAMGLGLGIIIGLLMRRN